MSLVACTYAHVVSPCRTPVATCFSAQPESLSPLESNLLVALLTRVARRMQKAQEAVSPQDLQMASVFRQGLQVAAGIYLLIRIAYQWHLSLLDSVRTSFPICPTAEFEKTM